MTSPHGAPPQAIQSEGATARRWSFAGVVLDERTLELTREGAAVRLERKPLEVLLFLLHHAGEVVTKDEILAAVWPGRILSDSVLTSAVARVREAIGDDEQAIIKTQHGYGYRLIAPVTVEAAPAVVPPRFDFGPGDSPPLRPRWKLEQRLGTGGHGEAWLARHEKTKEARVYKFALDRMALVSLKREITIYRLLQDTLPERNDFVGILDWNLEEPPYFLELEYAGLNLVQWAGSQGGLDHVPLETRLDLAAQVAEALAAAHSVGVLHKDLKPSNVLVAGDAKAPRIKLGDFGSGGVLDPARLEALGITRLGFTKSVAVDTTSGTPIYFAPEVIAGQPFTVQADVYALGVMLYQLAIGDLKKPLATGWEREITDELLSADVTAATEGNPQRRLPDAGDLAHRIRSLGARRQRRQAERIQAEQAREAQAQSQRLAETRRNLQHTRRVAAAMLGLAVAAVTAGVFAHRSRNEAIMAAETATAVSTFLNKDVLGGFDPNKESVRDIRLKDLLDRAAAAVQQRFPDRPEVAAEVHLALGKSYLGLQFHDAAQREYERAIALLADGSGENDERLLDAKRGLLHSASFADQPEAEALALALLGHAERTYGRTHPQTLKSRFDLAELHERSGRYRTAIDELQDLRADLRGLQDGETERLGPITFLLADALVALGEYSQAELTAREGLAWAEQQPFPKRQLMAAVSRFVLANALIQRGRYQEGETVLNESLEGTNQWFGKQAGLQPMFEGLLAGLRLEQGRYDEALAAVERLEASEGVTDTAGAEMVAQLSACIFQRQGRLADARQVLERSLAAPPWPSPAGTLRTIEKRLLLADVLREQHDLEGAQAQIDQVDVGTINGVAERHPLLADLRRVQGLVWLERGQKDRASVALLEAKDIYEFRLGTEHRLARRASAELSLAPSTTFHKGRSKRAATQPAGPIPS